MSVYIKGLFQEHVYVCHGLVWNIVFDKMYQNERYGSMSMPLRWWYDHNVNMESNINIDFNIF